MKYHNRWVKNYSIGIILAILIFSSFGYARGEEPAHMIQVETGTEYYVSDGSKLVMNFTLKTFSASDASIQLYGDQIKDWAVSLSASSLSVTAGKDVPFSISLDVPSGIPSGTYGLILQGLDGSDVIWKISLFVHVNEKKMLLDHPRVDHNGWISGENFPRELHLPYQEDVPVTIWVKYQNDTWYNLYVDVDVYRDGKFIYHKIADYCVQTSEPPASGVEGWVHFTIGESRQYESATYTYKIYVKNQPSGTSHKGTIETLSVTTKSYCPGAYPPLDTLSLNIKSASSGSSDSSSISDSSISHVSSNPQVSQEEFQDKIRELENKIQALNQTIIALNRTIIALNESFIGLNGTFLASIENVSESLMNLRSQLEALNESFISLNGTLLALKHNILASLDYLRSQLNTSLSDLRKSDIVLSERLQEKSRMLGDLIEYIDGLMNVTSILKDSISDLREYDLILSRNLQETSRMLRDALESIKDVTSALGENQKSLEGKLKSQEQAITLLSQNLNYTFGLLVLLIILNLLVVMLYLKMYREMKRR